MCCCCVLSSKACCAACKALPPMEASTTQLTFTSLVAIKRRLIPSLESVSNKPAAMPGRPMIPAPLMLSLLMPPSELRLPPRLSTSVVQMLRAWSRSVSATVKVMSLLLPSWVA